MLQSHSQGPSYLGPNRERRGWKEQLIHIHVLVIAGGRVLVISGNVELSALLDRDVLVTDRVTGTDLGSFLLDVNQAFKRRQTTTRELRTYGIKGNGEGTTSLGLLRLSGIVDDGLVVLALGESIVFQRWFEKIRTSYEP